MSLDAIDLKLKNWGESGSAGAWIKFDFADPDDLIQFKTKQGHFFKVFFVPVDANGEPLNGEQASQQEKIVSCETKTSIDDVKPEEWDQLNSIKTPQKLSNKSHFLLANENFQRYMGAWSVSTCDGALKRDLGITSKSELDTNPQAADRFKTLWSDYMKWLMKEEHQIIHENDIALSHV